MLRSFVLPFNLVGSCCASYGQHNLDDELTSIAMSEYMAFKCCALSSVLAQAEDHVYV